MKEILTEWRKFINEGTEEISLEEDGATIDGVVHTDLNRVLNWAEKEGIEKELIEDYELPVAILKNVYVPEESRGQGLGNQLVENFVEEAADFGADTIILIADLGEIQAEGFSLVDWYKGYGFEIIGEDSGNNPVMVKEQ